jgi:uncharacterized protein (TIGR02284 family)
MSTDERICTNLIHTLEDGQHGFETAAERLADSDRPEIASEFAKFGAERREMAQELQAIAASYGDEVDRRGTVAGALHRGWIGLKDALTGDDADAVIASAERGEDHALEQYREAVEADLSPEFRAVVERQMASVQRAHDYVRSLVPSR